MPPTTPPNTPTLDVLIQQLAPLAQRLGVATLLIAAKDPRTGEIGIFGSTEAMGELRETVEAKFVEKLGMVGETAWNDV